MSAPYWQLGAPYWELASLRTEGRPSIKRASTIRRTILPSPELIERDSADGGQVLHVKFAIFDRWAEIDSPEGHFLEKIARGAFRKTVKENLAGVRAILSHGKDPSLGQTVLGKIASIEEGPDSASAVVNLFRSVPGLLLDGLKAGVYGASFRGQAIKSQTTWHPGRSAHNPGGLPEVVRTEIKLKDVGPTPFAAYEGTTASIQGVDALVPARSRPAGLLEIERPSWYLGDLRAEEPAWQLQRRDRRGRTFVKA
jgi:phage head maturation protease